MGALFYTQGDYGLWQCSKPCHQKTYDNEEIVRRMIEAQGFVIGPDGALELPEGAALRMTVPAGLAPHCPVCGGLSRAYLKTQKCPKRQEKDTKGFYHRKQRE